MFKILKRSKKSRARLGVLHTAHGLVKAPFFMPCATQGTVKHITATEMKKLGARIILANTYHLMIQPGENVIKKIGGLHNFIDWDGPILTDSGGFQIFSLAGEKKKNGQSLVKLTQDGVKFKSYINGREYHLTPEKSFHIQFDLGVDIAVCLDVCLALPAKKKAIEKSVELTSYWAKRTKDYYKKLTRDSASSMGKSLLFAVIQGGTDKEMRLESLNDLIDIGFDGYNIGGLSVGETTEEMYKVLDYLVPAMPADQPRYLMGVGYPEQIVEAVKRGVDMFDCVIPTREGRHGRLFTSPPAPLLPESYDGVKIRRGELKGRGFYNTININRSRFAQDFTPINPESKLPELRQYSKAFLHHLFKVGEPLGQRLASLNNLEFYLDLMQKIRYSINLEKL
jgi:queuine tRNA-ribosyltransferase